jgi:hypothetical protein
MTEGKNKLYDDIKYLCKKCKNICEEDIKCPYKRYKNKKLLNLNVVMIYLIQKQYIKK